MNIWSKTYSREWNSRCKGPEVGVCLACLKTARSVWPVQWVESKSSKKHRSKNWPRVNHTCVRTKSLQSCPTVCNICTVTCRAPLSMGIPQARILEWVALPSSRGSSQPSDRARSLQSCLTLCSTADCSLPGASVRGDSPGKNTGVGYHALLQGIFQAQGSNPHLLCLLHWQVGSLPPVPPGKPVNHTSFISYCKNCDSTIKVGEHWGRDET